MCATQSTDGATPRVQEAALAILDAAMTREGHWHQRVIQRRNDEAGWPLADGTRVRLTEGELALAYSAAAMTAYLGSFKSGPHGVKESVAREVLLGNLPLSEVDERWGWSVDGFYLPLKDHEKEWVKAVVTEARTAPAV